MPIDPDSDELRIMKYYVKNAGDHREKLKNTLEELFGLTHLQKTIRVVCYSEGGEDFRARNENGDVLSFDTFSTLDPVIISNDKNGEMTEIFGHRVNCLVDKDEISKSISVVMHGPDGSVYIDFSNFQNVVSWGGKIPPSLDALVFRISI